MKRALTLLFPAVVVALVGYLIASRGAELGAALTSVSPWVLGAAVAAHLVTLALRTEAWRTVLRAAGGRPIAPRAVHAANAGAFLAGAVQGQAAMPTRVALLRRLGGADSPSVAQMALADAPIVVLEICMAGVLAAIGSRAVGLIPSWTPWVMLAGALLALVLLRLVHVRFARHRLAAGLGVLADARLGPRLVLIVVAFTAMAFVRTLIVMAGFGLPTDPAHVCLVLVTMGVVGLLPLGVGTGPASMVAALGQTTTLVTATAAGVVVSAATILAVLIYAAAVWAWQATASAPSWSRLRPFSRPTGPVALLHDVARASLPVLDPTNASS